MSVSNDISPAKGAFAVTPSDTVANVARALYIGVAGDVKVTTPNNATAVVFKAHPVGYLLCQVTLVWSAGTTATNILGLL